MHQASTNTLSNKQLLDVGRAHVQCTQAVKESVHLLLLGPMLRNLRYKLQPLHASTFRAKQAACCARNLVDLTCMDRPKAAKVDRP